LNRIQHFKGFVYRRIELCSHGPALSIEITLEAHAATAGCCAQCRQPTPGYDRLPERRWRFVPLWGIRTWFRYAPAA
jgi:hypothetical protein